MIRFLGLILAWMMLFATEVLPESWPLGTLMVREDAQIDCPQGFSCTAFEVECQKVKEAGRGMLAFAPSSGKTRGLVLFFTGSFGTQWWIEKDQGNYAFLKDLMELGFSIVQVRWKGSWLVSTAGEDAGIAHLACRPATVIRYVHDKIYVPSGVHPSHAGEAGFCITGNSGGASQVSYALSHYGLEDILDVVIPTGGPPHAALDKMCLDESDAKDLPKAMRHLIDRGFGYVGNAGPCVTRNSSFRARWLQESVATGGNDYYHQNTRIHFLIGQRDRMMQVIARTYYDRLRKEGSQRVAWETVSDTPHLVGSTANGLDALKKAILGSGEKSDRKADCKD